MLKKTKNNFIQIRVNDSQKNFLKLMASLEKISLSEYVSNIIEKDMEVPWKFNKYIIYSEIDKVLVEINEKNIKLNKEDIIKIVKEEKEKLIKKYNNTIEFDIDELENLPTLEESLNLTELDDLPTLE